MRVNEENYPDYVKEGLAVTRRKLRLKDDVEALIHEIILNEPPVMGLSAMALHKKLMEWCREVL